MSTPNQLIGESPSLILTAAPNADTFYQSDMYFEPPELYLFKYWLDFSSGLKPSPFRENTILN